MLDIECLIKAKRTTGIKKFFARLCSWKAILKDILSTVEGRFLLYCNFDAAKLN